jgi:hypothetical protein
MPWPEFEPATESVYISSCSPLLSIFQSYSAICSIWSWYIVDPDNGLVWHLWLEVRSWHALPLELSFSGRRYILKLYLSIICLQFCACLLFPQVTHFSPNSCRVPHVLRTPGTQRTRCSNLAVIKWNISCLTAANCCGGRRIVSPQCTLICPLHLASCYSLVCSSRNRRQAPARTVSPKIAFWISFGAPRVTNISTFACYWLWSREIPNVHCNRIEWLHTTHSNSHLSQ